MSDQPARGYMTEDLQPRHVDGPQRYASTTDGPVDFVHVANADGVVLGYLWISDGADAAGFAVRESAGNDAFNAGVYWFDQLRKAKGGGLSPSDALAWLRRSAGGERAGFVVPDSDSHLETLSELTSRAKRD